MQNVLVVEDADPEMRLMVWMLTDSGSQVRVATTVGAVISAIEEHRPDTVVFNSRMLGQAKPACIALIRELHPAVRIIDVSTPRQAGDKRFINITDHNESDPARDRSSDSELSGDGLIYMIEHMQRAG